MDAVCTQRRWWIEALAAAKGETTIETYVEGISQVLAQKETIHSFFRKWLIKTHPDKNKKSSAASFPTVDDVLNLRSAHRCLTQQWPTLGDIEGRHHQHQQQPMMSCGFVLKALTIFIMGIAFIHRLSTFIETVLFAAPRWSCKPERRRRRCDTPPPC